MRPALFIILLFLPLLLGAQYHWADSVNATTYSYKTKDSQWDTQTGKVLFCYDTYAFRFTAGTQHWFTGIEGYHHHLEDGTLIEEFFSQPHPPTGSELRFHIRRSTPAVITITHIPTGQTWLIRSPDLPEVKLRQPD